MWPWDNLKQNHKPMNPHGAPPGQEKHCPYCCVHCQNLGDINKKLDTILKALLALIELIEEEPKPKAVKLAINLGEPVTK